MPATAQNIDWYNLTKDIIIPTGGVLSTIVLGTFIAYLLKNKEEKSKIKTLLIDNYMLYLNRRISSFEQELTSFRLQVIKDIYNNYDRYFTRHSNDHLAKTEIAKVRDQLKSKLNSYNSEDANWSTFTYKFAFLLGKKKYFKYALPLENRITEQYLSDSARTKFLRKVENKIASNQIIVANMNQVNINMICEALDEINKTIAIEFNDFQFGFFNPYNNKIADLIAEY